MQNRNRNWLCGLIITSVKKAAKCLEISETSHITMTIWLSFWSEESEISPLGGGKNNKIWSETKHSPFQWAILDLWQMPVKLYLWRNKKQTPSFPLFRFHPEISIASFFPPSFPTIIIQFVVLFLPLRVASLFPKGHWMWRGRREKKKTCPRTA